MLDFSRLGLFPVAICAGVMQQNSERVFVVGLALCSCIHLLAVFISGLTVVV